METIFTLGKPKASLSACHLELVALGGNRIKSWKGGSPTYQKAPFSDRIDTRLTSYHLISYRNICTVSRRRQHFERSDWMCKGLTD